MKKKVKGSALLSSVLLLLTCLLFLKGQESVFRNRIENDQLIIKYLQKD